MKVFKIVMHIEILKESVDLASFDQKYEKQAAIDFILGAHEPYLDGTTLEYSVEEVEVPVEQRMQVESYYGLGEDGGVAMERRSEPTATAINAVINKLVE